MSKNTEMALTMSDVATSLHLAAGSGDLEEVRSLLQCGNIDVDCTDQYGQTPAHYACTGGHLDVITMLVSEYKADLDKRDDTPLLVAAQHGHNHVLLTLLCEYHCSASDTKKCNQTIFNFNFDLNRTDAYCKSLLHYACEWGDLALAKALVQNYNSDIYAVDGEGNTPFDLAVIKKHSMLVLTFVKDFGYDSYRTNALGRTLLHYACEWGDVELIQTMMIKNTIDIYALDSDKCTPLDLAALHHNVNVIKFFSFNETIKIDIGKHGAHGKTLLHNACEWGNIELVRTLYKCKAPINALDDKNNTPFDAAVKEKKSNVILMFIREFDWIPEDTHEMPLLYRACVWEDASTFQL